MKHLFLITTFTFLFTATFSQLGCAQNKIDPYFPGLTEGIQTSENCLSFQDYSVNLTDIDGDQQFDLYQGTACEGKIMQSLTLGIEANLAGVWKNFLIFDEGTDINGRNLRLTSITDKAETYSLFFEGKPPEFKSNKIVYFSPSEQQASADQCDSVGIDFKDLKEHATDVLIGHKFEFSAETKKSTPIHDQYTCYPVQ